MTRKIASGIEGQATRNLVFLVFAASWLAALAYSSLTGRALYGDGAYTLLFHLQHPFRFNDYDFARSFASFGIQAPVLAGQRLGLQGVQAYAFLLSVGLYVLPALTWLAALFITRASAVLFVLTALAIVVFGFGANLVNTEANHMMPLCWLCAMVMCLPASAPILRGIALPLAAFALLRIYEGMLLAGPVLALWAFLRERSVEAIGERVGLALAGFLFAIASFIALGAYLAPRDPYNAANFTQAAFHYLGNPQRLLFAATACAAGAALVANRRIAIALTVASVLLGVGFVLAIWRLQGFYSFGVYYNNRAFLVLLLPVVLGMILFVHVFRPLWLTTPLVGIGTVAVPVAFMMAISGDVIGTYRWTEYIHTFCDVLERPISPSERLDVLKSSGARTAWSWTHPTMSVLLRPRGSNAIVVNEPGQRWEPFDPSSPVSIPYRGFCQGSISGARSFDSFSVPIAFTGPEYPTYVKKVSGLSHPEGWATWSDGKLVQISLQTQLPQSFQLRIAVAAAFGANRGVPIKVEAGGVEKYFTVDREPYEVTLDFDHVGRADTVTIDIPKPQSPTELGAGKDDRKLGLAFVSLKIEPKPVADPSRR